jgi:hypothetical protein
VGDDVTMLVVAFSAWSLLAAADVTLPTAKVAVVAEVPVGEGKKDPLFTVGVGQCAKPKGTPKDAPADCGVFVGLKRGGKGQKRLEWLGKAGPITHPNTNTFVVTAADDEEQSLTTRFNPVVVGNANQKAGVSGLLVSQEERRGDRVRRRYDVFLADRGSLKHAFTGAEGRGARTWSSLEAVDIDHDGGNELVFFTSSTANEDVADRFEMQIYSWRADVRKMVARNDLRPAIKGAIIGMFKTIEAARAMQDRPCTYGFLVLDSSSADKLGDGQVVLASPAITKSDAELALEDAKTCDANMVGAVKAITTGVDIDADQEE